jgi:o-succinylbenzoate---CoA ligase
MDWLSRAAVERPTAPALIISPGRTISYAELDRAADGAASIVEGSGFGGEPIALAGDPTDVTVAALWGIPRARSTAVVLDPLLPPAEAMRLTRSAGARGLFGSPDGGFDRLVSRGRSRSGSGPPDGGATFVVATSGSEGRRKGVVITGDNVAASVAGSRSRLGNTPDDAWLCVLPLFHIGGLAILWRQAEVGAPVRLAAPFEPDEVAALGDEVSYMSLVPTMLHRVLGAGATGSATILVGGGPVPRSLIARAHRAGFTALQTYGMTETTSQVCTVAPGDAMSDDGSAGRPIDGADVRVVAAGRRVVGVEGRIEVRGPVVSPGYVGEEPRAAGSWFVTGDLGIVDTSGRLTVLGRADAVIVTGGENVDPAVVERRLLSHPAVVDVRVFGEADETWGARVVAEAVLDGATGEEVLAWSRAHLTPAETPKEIRVVERPGSKSERQ